MSSLRLLIATAVVVALLLILTYRSPVLWLDPAHGRGRGRSCRDGDRLPARQGLRHRRQRPALGMLTILVFGVGTDYALLLIARYRKHCTTTRTSGSAMVHALRRTAPAIVASAATVVVGLLCLLVADLNSTSGLPIGAAGHPVRAGGHADAVVSRRCSCVLGRRIFWPVPQSAVQHGRGAGPGAGSATPCPPPPPVGRRLGSLGVPGVLAVGLAGNTGALREQDQFRPRRSRSPASPSAAEHFPGARRPAVTVTTRPAHQERVLDIVEGTPAWPRPRRADAAGLDRPSRVPDGRAGHRRGVRHDQAGAHRRARGERGGGDRRRAERGGDLDTGATATRDAKLVISRSSSSSSCSSSSCCCEPWPRWSCCADRDRLVRRSLRRSVFVFDTTCSASRASTIRCRCWHSCSWWRSASTTTSSWPAGPGRRPCGLGTREGMLSALSATGGVITAAGILLRPRSRSSPHFRWCADRGRVPGRLRRAARHPAGAVGPGARPHPAARRRFWWPSRVGAPQAQPAPSTAPSTQGPAR